MSFDFNYKEPKVVAEIGCNHMGRMVVAKELIDLAHTAGARYVKFQKRNNRELLTDEQYNALHPVPKNSYGKTYGEHREFLEFNQAQHRELKEYCESLGVVYSTSVWDATSAREIIDLNPEFIKVPSACNNNKDLLRCLRDNYNGGIQVSIGMTTREEVEDMVRFFEETGQARERLLVYACTSGYPVTPQDVALLEINWLYQEYGNRVSEIGFSGHHLGTALDVAAYTLGARWVERHFTKSKSWKGTDHGASLEPDELRNLITGLTDAYQALHQKSVDILPIEQAQREKLKNRK